MAASTAAQADGVVAQLASLKDDARAALDGGRSARACELYERALAAAEAALPTDCLVNASMLYMSSNARITTRMQEAGHGVVGGDVLRPKDVERLSTPELAAVSETLLAPWRTDALALEQSRRCLALLLGRWRAGTLLTPSSQECAFFGANDAAAALRLAKSAALELFFGCASDAALYWPPLSAPADEEARLRGVHGALVALMAQMPECRGAHLAAPPNPEGPLIVDPSTMQALSSMVDVVLHGKRGDMALQTALRATCAMSEHDVQALQVVALVLRVKYMGQSMEQVSDMFDVGQRRAQADVARHGLRACALPGCGAVEPSPKAFKVCGRCRAAAYCCAAHQADDWRRHKRADRCTPPAAAATAAPQQP
jgi:hypothetical protein